MSLTGLKPHRAKLLLLAVMTNTSLVASLILGEVKTWGEIDWLDVFGEGGTAAMLMTWLIFILRSRPAGRVSTILTAGFGLVFLALWQGNTIRISASIGLAQAKSLGATELIERANRSLAQAKGCSHHGYAA